MTAVEDADASRNRWNRRYEGDSIVGEPSAWLVSLGSLIPNSGCALDIAGGTGRNSLWLAERGLSVTLVDISSVGLAAAHSEAGRRGVSIETVEGDLEAQPLPPGPWDLLVCFHYLQRSLFEAFPKVLRPGGLLLCEMATVRNLERHEHPVRQFLLEEGELSVLAQGMEVVSYSENWTGMDQHLARLVARPGVSR